MSIPVLTFFNNKGGVGKTSLIYHLAWMLSERMPVLVADLDPQANLTSLFLDEDRIEVVSENELTIAAAIDPVFRGVGDITNAHVEKINEELGLIPGDLALSRCEDVLYKAWDQCQNSDASAFRITSAFWRILQNSAQKTGARLILIDVGSNLGALNRAALISANYVVIPMTPDLFSLQGLRNLGPTIKNWRNQWNDRRKKNMDNGLESPNGDMNILGYVLLQYRERLNRPTQAYRNFSDQFQATYREYVLDDAFFDESASLSDNEYCLGLVKNFGSLMPMAQRVRKPIFNLTIADGAIGAHAMAVRDAYYFFKILADKLLEKMNISMNAND